MSDLSLPNKNAKDMFLCRLRFLMCELNGAEADFVVTYLFRYVGWCGMFVQAAMLASYFALCYFCGQLPLSVIWSTMLCCMKLLLVVTWSKSSFQSPCVLDTVCLVAAGVGCMFWFVNAIFLFCSAGFTGNPSTCWLSCSPNSALGEE